LVFFFFFFFFYGWGGRWGFVGKWEERGGGEKKSEGGGNGDGRKKGRGRLSEVFLKMRWALLFCYCALWPGGGVLCDMKKLHLPWLSGLSVRPHSRAKLAFFFAFFAFPPFLFPDPSQYRRWLTKSTALPSSSSVDGLDYGVVRFVHRIRMRG